MKKINFLILLFFLIPLNNSFSDPIKVLGIDVTMGKQTAKEILTKKNFVCNDVMEMIMCDKSGGTVTVSKDLIQITCAVYGGCKYTAIEVANFFSKELNLKIRNPEVVGIFQEPAYCGEGPDGDKLCVVYSLTSNLGPNIDITKHKLGGTGMSLN